MFLGRLSELELIKLVQRGNDRAFGELANRHLKDMLLFAGKLKGEDDIFDPSDLVSKALQGLHRQLQAGKDIHRIAPYLRKSIKNAHLDWLRKHNRLKTVPIEASLTRSDSSKEAEWRELKVKLIFEELNKLRLDQRIIFTERIFENRSFADIAADLRIDEGSVINIFYAARSYLIRHAHEIRERFYDDKV